MSNLEGYRFFLIFIFFFILSKKCFTQEVTESADNVNQNTLQIESAFHYLKLGESELSSDNFTIAGTLLRYGISENIELRFGSAFFITKNNEQVDRGIGNILLGTKLNFLTGGKNDYGLAVMFHANLPVGTENYRPKHVEPELIVAASKYLSSRFFLSLNLGSYYSSSLKDLNFLYSSSLRFIPDNNLGAFLEIYGDLSPALIPVHYYNAGLTFIFSENLSADFSGGKSFSEENLWFIGVEFSLAIVNL